MAKGGSPEDSLARSVNALIRIAQYMDAALKQGIVIGVYQDSFEVSDEDILKACTKSKKAIQDVTEELEKMLRAIARKPLIVLPGGKSLQ